jgi:hypothetical protein
LFVSEFTKYHRHFLSLFENMVKTVSQTSLCANLGGVGTCPKSFQSDRRVITNHKGYRISEKFPKLINSPHYPTLTDSVVEFKEGRETRKKHARMNL